jgi:agmatinase
VFFGCPFDAGSSYRSGSRFGPKVIRETSQMLLTNCGSDYAPWADKNFGKLRIYDGGDAAPTPFDLMTAVKQIYVCTKVLWNTASKVVAVGGDHTLSWSFLAAARDKNNGKPVPIVHLDAHYDTGTEYLGSKLSHGTALGRAGSGGCIDYERSQGGLHYIVLNPSSVDVFILMGCSLHLILSSCFISITSIFHHLPLTVDS